ncbi:MAG: methyltransferase domain-containing protein [Beijerinckiaceae bacterium]|nr:methyltransferase domain-containing protein [Beijerinckiaceae bacterium]
MSSELVRIFGWRATLHHGDALVWDRWRWLSRRLRRTQNDERLLDVGCGSGAFTIGAAKLGYKSLGLSWDQRNQDLAQERARMVGADGAAFEICDVRELDAKDHLRGVFDIVICTENIEHVIDDFRLVSAMAACLKPGGRLLLTTPQLSRIPQNEMDHGPFPDIEDGRHVRRGYNRAMLIELCAHAGLSLDEIGYVSGPVAQLQAWLLWRLREKFGDKAAWALSLPLRPLAPLLDPLLMKLPAFPPFCITLEAHKPRDAKAVAAAAARALEKME